MSHGLERLLRLFGGLVAAQAFVAAQNTVTEDVKARRAKSRSQYVAIADRCLQRLNRKGNRLLLAGKHPNKVKVACAREMVYHYLSSGAAC